MGRGIANEKERCRSRRYDDTSTGSSEKAPVPHEDARDGSLTNTLGTGNANASDIEMRRHLAAPTNCSQSNALRIMAENRPPLVSQ
jgi:hypothetical protein